MPNHRSHTARRVVGTHATECHFINTGSGGTLAHALEVIIGWYEDPLGGGLPKRRTQSRRMRSGEVVQRYLALRTEWENREAFRLAEHMSGYRHPAAGRSEIVLQVGGPRGYYAN